MSIKICYCNRHLLYLCIIQLYISGVQNIFEVLFYDPLTKLRIEKGVSARDMSLTIGQSSGYINGLENRNGFPSIQVFINICEYLGVTPSEFFDDSINCPTEYKEIISDLNVLDMEQLHNIQAIIKG